MLSTQSRNNTRGVSETRESSNEEMSGVKDDVQACSGGGEGHSQRRRQSDKHSEDKGRHDRKDRKPSNNGSSTRKKIRVRVKSKPDTRDPSSSPRPRASPLPKDMTKEQLQKLLAVGQRLLEKKQQKKSKEGQILEIARDDISTTSSLSMGSLGSDSDDDDDFSSSSEGFDGEVSKSELMHMLTEGKRKERFSRLAAEAASKVSSPKPARRRPSILGRLKPTKSGEGLRRRLFRKKSGQSTSRESTTTLTEPKRPTRRQSLPISTCNKPNYSAINNINNNINNDTVRKKSNVFDPDESSATEFEFDPPTQVLCISTMETAMMEGERLAI